MQCFHTVSVCKLIFIFISVSDGSQSEEERLSRVEAENAELKAMLKSMQQQMATMMGKK